MLTDRFICSTYCALDYAVKNGHIECVELLINKHAAPSYLTFKYAIKNNRADIVKLLLKNSLHDVINRAFYYCCKSNNSTFEIMLPHVTNYNCGLSGACRAGNWELFNFLAENPANDFNYLVENAIKGGNSQIMKFLLKIDAGFDNGKRLREALEENEITGGLKKMRLFLC